MVKVVRTDKEGNERVMLLTHKVWNKMVSKPKLIPGMKWRLWVAEKPRTTRFVEVPIDAEVEIKMPVAKKVETKPEKSYLITANADDANLTTIEEIKPYGEKEYKSDLVLGKKLAADGNKDEAKAAFKRTLQLKPKNPYVKKQIKILES